MSTASGMMEFEGQNNDFGGTKRYKAIPLVPPNSFGPPTMVAVVVDLGQWKACNNQNIPMLNFLRRGCNSYKQYVVSILLQHVFIVTILLQHISLVTMQIGCNNVKIKHLLLQRLQLLRNVVTQILVAAINGICSVPNSSSELIFYKNPGGIRADFL